MRVIPVACLKDNYAYLVVDDKTNEAAVVDPSEAAPVLDAVARENVKLSAIWNTHHHFDHVGGNDEIAKNLGVEVLGHASDKGRIPSQTKFLETGARFSLHDIEIEIRHIPGHTLGAIAYIAKAPGEATAVFTGDTLFVAGCGRLFEGTPAMMHASLSSLLDLPDTTRVYCGHEYTEGNLRFAAHAEPSNQDVARALASAKATREAGKPTVPSTLGDEKKVNPFLRVGSAEIRKTLGIAPDADAATAFGAVRSAKDSFR